MTTRIQIGSVEVEVRALAAHLYLQLGERPIGPEYDEQMDEVSRAAAQAYDLEFYAPSTERDAVTQYLTTATKFLTKMSSLVKVLRALPIDATEEEIQFEFYEEAKRDIGDDKSQIREFFKLIYLFIFDSWSGPRFGQFVKVQGIPEFIAMVENRLTNPLLIPLKDM